MSWSSNCDEIKDASYFYKTAGRVCKDCRNEQRRKRKRQTRLNFKERQLDSLSKNIVIENEPTYDESTEFEHENSNDEIDIGCVYFIRLSVPRSHLDFNHTKIGMTGGDPMKRLAQLQTGNSHKLFIYKTIKTQFPADLEKKIHAKLHKEHVHGEWFNIPESLIDILCEHWAHLFYQIDS